MVNQVLAKAILAFSLLGPVITFDFLENSETYRKSSFLETQVPLFRGNETHRDYFKLLREDSGSVLVGARNIIYNLSLPDLSEHIEERIYWPSSEGDRELCLIKGKQEDDCQNYIRVLARVDDTTILVCGTNSYSPLCRHYTNTGQGYEVMKQFSGKGYAPYDPKHNSTSLFTGGDLYAATVSDFSGTDSLIIKNQLRTEQYDYKHLNAPDFVSSLEDEDFVYFFFRESAVEQINCGKTIFSRVARVCKSDQGGSHKFKNRWTTYLKSRLNCSIPGDYPFYFNEIQSTTAFFAGHGEEKVVYMVFTTPLNSIPGSAVCRFSLDSITSSFAGDFKNQASVNSNWLPFPTSQVPSPRPGACTANSSVSTVSESSLHFIKNHCLMDQSVNSDPQQPVFIRAGIQERFTKITVDKDVRSLDGSVFDVLFIGTDAGRILKVTTSSSNPSHENSRLVEAIQLFPPSTPIRNLQIVRSMERSESMLVVLSDDEVKSIPLEHCTVEAESAHAACNKCIGLRSPYCGWDQVRQLCVSLKNSWGAAGGSILQELRTGAHAGCPPRPTTTTTTTTTTSTTTTTTEAPTTTTVELIGETTILPDLSETWTDDLGSVETSSETTLPPFPSTRASACPSCTCSCPSVPTRAPQVDTITGNTGAQAENDTNILIDRFEDNLIDNEIEDEVKFEVLLEETTEEALSLPVKSDDQSPKFNLTTLVIICLMTGLVTLVVGFLAGYFTNRVLSFRSGASVTSSNVSLVKPCPLDKPHHEDSGYNTPTTPGSSINPTPTYTSSNPASPYSLPPQPTFPTPSPPLDFRNNNDSPQSLPPKPFLPMDSMPMTSSERSVSTSSSSARPERARVSSTSTLQRVKRVYL